MKVLIVYCHPDPQSYNAALRDTVLRALQAAGHEPDLIDLYADGFDPVLNVEDWRIYHDATRNAHAVSDHVTRLKACDAIVFVYPTWWYGLPAMLKGWLDRVFLPGAAFILPETGAIRPALQNIGKIGVITTCGASRSWSHIVGEPGRKQLLRGIRALLAPRCKRLFLAHYQMDDSTPQSRAEFLSKVEKKMRQF